MPFTVDTLTRDQLADLHALALNPRHPMTASRIAVFRELNLIVPDGPPRPPCERQSRRPPPRRSHKLTELGQEVVAKHPDVRPAQNYPGKVGWK